MNGLRSRNRALYSITGLFMILFFMFTGNIACQCAGDQQELESCRKQAVVAQQNEDAIRNLFDKLNQHDLAFYETLYAPEYESYTPSNSPDIITREQERATIEQLIASFPDMQWHIQDLMTSGDWVIIRFTVTGTHEAAYEGIEPTGARIESGGLWLARLQDGKLVEAREEFDAIGWVEQLGMTVVPAEDK